MMVGMGNISVGGNVGANHRRIINHYLDIKNNKVLKQYVVLSNECEALLNYMLLRLSAPIARQNIGKP